MPAMPRLLTRIVLAAGLIVAAGFAVLCTPQPLFAHRLTYGRYQVWSDRPIEPQIKGVLDDVTARISRSAIYSPGQRFRIFICNDPWRLALYSQRFSGGMGGVADTAFTRNVYVRRSDIPRNRLIPPSGWNAAKMADRPLSYYLAHELTHVMESRAFGRGSAVRYPDWLNEGYADYVAKAGRFDMAENARALRAGALAMDPKMSGLYRRHHLEVAYLLDRQGATIQELYADPPDEAALRARIIADPSLP
jgi:hypothetical protein